MIYLKEFATAQDYENAKEGLLTPNVSLITENGEVKYLKGEPTPPVPIGPTITCTYHLDNAGELWYGSYFLDQVDTMKLDDIITTINNPVEVSAGEHMAEYILNTSDLARSVITDDNNLTSVNLQGITTIEDGSYGNEGAFTACTALATIVIGSEITYIGEAAFADNENLTSITVNATTPPTLGSYVFDGSTCPIYVPAASVDTYKAAEGWSTYADRIQAIQ